MIPPGGMNTLNISNLAALFSWIGLGNKTPMIPEGVEYTFFNKITVNGLLRKQRIGKEGQGTKE